MRTVNKRDFGLTNKQLALVHLAKKELGLTEEDYRNVLQLYGGVDSAKHLRLDGLERVMEQFERLGFKSTAGKGFKQPRHAKSRDADGQPYPAQLHMIRHHFEQVGFTETERQQGFCRRIIKKPWPQTRAEANKIFEALKAMIARGYKPQ